jgi:hypothetical protein
MAVVNTLGSLVSNYDASPRILSSGYESGANDTNTVGIVAAVSTDSIGSTYRFAFLPSGVRIIDIQMQNDATTTGVWQMGVYGNDQQPCTTVTGGAKTVAAVGAIPVANANLILGAAVSTVAAKTIWTSVYSPTILAAAQTASNTRLRIWELLGLDADPEYVFHLVLTSTTAPTANGKIALQMTWAR